MRKHITISCLAALLGLSQTAAADSGDGHNAGSTTTDRLETTASFYPEAWCIETFLKTSSRTATVSRRAPPTLDRPVSIAINPVVSEASIAATAYTDRSSLIERLKALKSRPVATLWRGRETALVLRVQDGGYFGVSIDDRRTDAN